MLNKLRKRRGSPGLYQPLPPCVSMIGADVVAPNRHHITKKDIALQTLEMYNDLYPAVQQPVGFFVFSGFTSMA